MNRVVAATTIAIVAQENDAMLAAAYPSLVYHRAVGLRVCHVQKKDKFASMIRVTIAILKTAVLTASMSA